MVAATANDEYNPSKTAAAVRLASHIAYKGFQAGGVIGVLAAPIAGWRAKSFDVATLTKGSGYSAIALTGLTAVMGAARISQLDADGIHDRAYRLYYNEGQNRTDLFATVGALLGLATVGYALGGNTRPLNAVGGAALGAAAGIVAHVLTASNAKPDVHKLKHELTTPQ